MKADQLRQKYLNFFAARGHKVIPAAPLVPENDSTTLFTGSGMQPMIGYLLGKKHPLGKRIVDSQPCIRAEDIEEVADNRHLTFFEMLGNWSLGDYFKKEQLTWIWEFLTQELKLQKDKLYVSIFEGQGDIPKDLQSKKTWLNLGVLEDHIFEYGVKKNWWNRGKPFDMPPGEPGGPDSEVFFEFTHIKHDPKYGEKCHPNCDCGRFLEISNSVFIQYQKQKDGSLKELQQKNVDFGGGLERLVAATNNDPDIFKTDLFSPLIKIIEQASNKKFSDRPGDMRIIADHLKAASFMIAQGLKPGNKQQGYVLRRLIRRSLVKMRSLNIDSASYTQIAKEIINQVSLIYSQHYPEVKSTDVINSITNAEIEKFSKSLDRGLKEFNKATDDQLDASFAFDLYQSYGFPIEISQELFAQRDKQVNLDEFNKIKQKHQQLSRTAASGMFKGGLADQGEITTKYHTATHLLHQALRDVLGEHVKQAGSNITADRLRFDFSHDKALTLKQLKKIEAVINSKIKEDLPVSSQTLAKDKALKLVTAALFKARYPETVSVYSIGDYSREICGGPHVTSTAEIGKIGVVRQESSGSGVRRVYLKLKPDGDKQSI